MARESDGPWYYEQTCLGYNYRMTDLQAALGTSQMKRLNDFVSQRHELASRYDDMLSNYPLTIPWQHPDTYSAYHLYPIRLQLDESKKGRLEIFEYLRSYGIGVNVHYIPVPSQPYYESMGFDCNDYPEAIKYYREAISLPIYPGLTFEQQEFVVQILDKALGK